jgi:Tfp pilus assembly protein PilN
VARWPKLKLPLPKRRNRGRPSANKRFARAVAHAVYPCGDRYYMATVESARDGSYAVLQSAWLSDAASSSKRKRGTVILTLPRKDVILREIDVPSTNITQIQSMMTHEIRTLLPWPEEEGLASYQIRRGTEDGYSTVQVFLVRRQTVDSHLEHLAKAGLRVARIEVSTLSLARLLAAHDDNDAAIVGVNHNTFDYVRLRAGEITFSRGTALSGPLDECVRQSIELDRRKSGAAFTCGTLYVSGVDTGSVEVNLAASVGGASILDARQLLGRSPGADIEGLDVFCVGAALSVRDGAGGINLLPEQEASRLAWRQVFKRSIVLAIMLAWIAGVVTLTGFYFFSTEQAQLAQHQQAIDLLKKDVGSLKAKNEQLELLAKEHSTVSLPLEVVLELYARVPNDIAVNHMRFDARGTLLIGGEGPSYVSVLKCIESLQQSSMFTNVEMLYSAKPKSAEGAAVEFKCQCKVSTK